MYADRSNGAGQLSAGSAILVDVAPFSIGERTFHSAMPRCNVPGNIRERRCTLCQPSGRKLSKLNKASPTGGCEMSEVPVATHEALPFQYRF